MVSSTKTRRYVTGAKCAVSGRYDFDGYVDGTRYPNPRPEELRIPLKRGSTFPPIRSTGKACYWLRIGRG
jgi:hypothetical protein